MEWINELMNEKIIYSVCAQLIDTVRKITQNSTNNFPLMSVQMEKSTSQKQHLGNQNMWFHTGIFLV